MANPLDTAEPGTAAVAARLDRLPVTRTHRRATVAVFSHADVIKLLVAFLAGVPMDLFQRLVIDPASISAVSVGDGIPRILRVNDRGSLGDLAPRKPAKRNVGG